MGGPEIDSGPKVYYIFTISLILCLARIMAPYDVLSRVYTL